MDMQATRLTSASDSFGRRIRLARVAKGWTLGQLAEVLDVSKVTIWSWEQGKNRPRVARLAELAAALGLPIGTLADDQNNREELDASKFVFECQLRIAERFGVRPDDVEIKVSFGGLNAPDVGEETESDAQRFLSRGGALRLWREKLIRDLGSLKRVGRGEGDPVFAELTSQCALLDEEIATLIQSYSHNPVDEDRSITRTILAGPRKPRS